MSTSEASDEDENLVEAWTTTHSDPKFQTDLWIIVSENGEEIRIPGCSVILRMHSGLVQGLPMDTDELHIPGIVHDARTVVLFLSLCYPPLSTIRPFDQLYERALSDPAEAREDLFKIIPKLAKFAHWCDAPAVLDRLQYVMIQLTNKHKRSNFKFTKAFFVAVFALEDVGRGIPLDDRPNGISIEFVFPDIYIQMNDEERKRYAGHALRMFKGFLEYPDLAQTASRSYDVSARLVALTRFLLTFLPKPRRSVSTQTGSD